MDYRDDPTPVAFRAPIREYLEREISSPTVTDDSAAYSLFAAVELLHKWNDPKDNALLLKYLTHPFRVRQSRGNGEEWYDYRLRQYVRSWLAKRGVPIPAGVVYEEVVTPGK